MRTLLSLAMTALVAMALSVNALAQENNAFDKYFIDETLRVDYVFAGDAHEQHVFLDCLSSQKHWAGRRVNLKKAFYKGNGSVTMRSKKNGEVIYVTTFSSLFQEYIVTEEAENLARSFENCFLLPMPKEAVDVECVIYNKYGSKVASINHTVDPKDILIHHLWGSDISGRNVTTIHRGGSYDKAIDVAILSEGYTAKQSNLFLRDAKNAVMALFDHEPFASYKSRFNVHAVFVPSIESGVSIPKDGEWKNTALGSHFSTFYSDRYLTTLKLKAVYNALGSVDYEHIIILANTAEYGGGGIYNSYTLASVNHPEFLPVVVHEFGHSFGGLADEYFYTEEADTATYSPSVEPWEPNITTQKDFGKKWQKLIDKKEPGVGIYEGAGYSGKLIYRGFDNCRMRTNEHPDFCPVCRDALERLIKYYTESAR